MSFSQLLPTVWLTRTGFLLIVLLAIFALFYIIKVILIKKGKEFFAFSSSVWKSVKKAIAKNPDIRKFAVRHKSFFLICAKTAG